MNDTVFCKQCGKETSILNGQFCSRICESGWEADEKYNHPYSNREDIIVKHTQRLPTWDEVVNDCTQRPRVLSSNLSRQDKERMRKYQIGKMRMYEERKHLESGKRFTPLVYKKLERINL